MPGQPERFDDAERLADAIVARVGRKIVMALPLGLGKANHIVNALTARAIADPSISLSILTALTLEKPRASSDLERRFLEPVAERLFAGYPELRYATALRQGTLPPNIEVHEFFLMAGRWLGSPRQQQNYISANYTHVGRYILERGVNVLAQLVAPPERAGGGYSLSCNPDVTPDFLAARRGGQTGIVFVGEVNDALPFMDGAAEVPAAEFDFLLEGDDFRFPLFAPPREPVTPADYAIGLNIAGLVPDGGTLQVGIGSIGDAIGQGLVLRHRDNAIWRATLERLGSPPRETARFEEGLYGASEMLVECFLDLMEAGIVKREVDGVAIHAGFFLGSRNLYARLKEMTPEARRRIAMVPVSFVNELYGDEAGKRAARKGARFINTAMMATLSGAVVSDGLDDGRVVSGVGGQYNFVSQAFALPDARSVIALRATREKGGEALSNVVFSYGHQTIPRHLRDIVVTEYGVADLRGKTDAEVVAAMLGVADSRFQAGLLARAKKAGKIAADYEIPPARRNNRPERIAAGLADAKAQGLLPLFPFGSDFTAVEQALMPALGRLSRASKRELARMALKGGPSNASTNAALERMGLARPSSFSERLYRRLLLAALAAPN
ncbi:acetyl-CoA hydrolase/transferase C-terminal domain-containing protein [Parvibaculum sp.]|uniref:acetyl-CoA hydrolase/transferase C-terminal domain-containing protein n=1 Tax=Parvibaculum sp. TaxID=2024848 RepID=UPI001DA692D4|nr:acetyl-CoA hydrolase/transferase C-terminal domain-containing protein [Parvibaculum sp.]MBX3490021.1 acetyl-CoA hydrolase/transferase family protein [Parvibaculum sp.]MCW5725991.1 acetyl-CoA hydrolase/transferase family protein [Parvibaculum sp.]